MRGAALLRAVAVAAGWAAVVAGAHAMRPAAASDQRTPPNPHAVEERAPPDSGVRATLLRAARSAPFRASRQAPDVRYDPQTLGAPPVPATATPPKPTLTLVGLVLDGAPKALIQGIPGATGARLLGVGDTAGGVRVRRIQSDRVRVTGHDTAWTLELRSVD